MQSPNGGCCTISDDLYLSSDVIANDKVGIRGTAVENVLVRTKTNDRINETKSTKDREPLENSI